MTSDFGELDGEWGRLLAGEREKAYYRELISFVEKEYREGAVYPPRSEVFRALELTPYGKVKVVILGQDPYHGAGQAHGLSFSVKPGVKLPPSLRNIFKELSDDIGCPIPGSGSLEQWAKQGVLLLNSVMTVRDGEANSHRKLGWEKFTDRIVALLNERETPIAFVLWGKPAQEKGRLLDQQRHFVLNSVHPSPLAAYGGFWGSKPFSRCNAFLMESGIDEVDWRLPEQGDSKL